MKHKDTIKKKIVINSESLKKYHGFDSIDVDFNGDKPKEKYWRDRLNDAKYDKCISVVNHETKKVKVKSDDK